MVESTKTTAVTESLGITPTGKEQNLTTDAKVRETVKNFREIQQSILDDIKNPQGDANPQGATLDELMRQLQTAIDQ